MTKRRLEALARLSLWIGFALFCWIMFLPDPYSLAIIIALLLPWVSVALVISFPKVLSLGLQGPARGALGGISVLPCLTLLLRGLLEFTFLDEERLLLVVLLSAATLGLALLYVLPARPTHWGDWLVLGLALLSYAFGATAQIDTVPDRAATQTYRTTVARKYVSHGKTWTYHLELAPWGPDQSKSSARISGDFYARVRPGMQVCATLHPGFIGLRWYDVGFC